MASFWFAHVMLGRRFTWLLFGHLIQFWREKCHHTSSSGEVGLISLSRWGSEWWLFKHCFCSYWSGNIMIRYLKRTEHFFLYDPFKARIPNFTVWMTKGFISNTSLKYLGRGIMWVLGRNRFSSLKCLFADLICNSENTLLKAFTVRFSATGVILCRWVLGKYIATITDVHRCCGKTVGLYRVHCSGWPHLGGGKSHLVLCLGKGSRLLSSELDSVAKAPQPINSVLLSIPEEWRLSSTALPP